MTCARPHLPLHDIRVLDLTHVWSGPSATRLLAGLGADVIKVESGKRLDFLRGTGNADVRSRYPNLDHGKDPWNRNAWFNTVNTDKRDVAIDLKTDAGRELVFRLVEESQLVIANFRPGVLDRMGLGFAMLRERRPDVSLVEMTGYGSTGPMAGLQAYGAQFDAMSGSAYLTGDGRRPMLTGFALSDPVAGLAAASAAVTAISRWRRTGRGTNIEVVQRDAMVPLHGEYLLAVSRGETVGVRLNRDPDAPLQGIFDTASGRSVAVSVRDQSEWDALRHLLDEGTREKLAAHQSLVAVAEDVEAVEQCLAGWFARRADAAAVADELQGAGVPAAPVNDCADVYGDEAFATSGFFRELDHPRTGRHRYPCVPFTVDGHRPAPRTPAPVLDQHTDEVLTDILGLAGERVRDLRERGVVGVPPDLAPRHDDQPAHDTTTKETP